MQFTRVRFFDGQMLSVDDFNAEQTYSREKRKLHNRMLYGVGVVTGLGVSVDREPDTIIVSPGFAIDASGNEVVVESPARVKTCGYERCFVVARYTETPARPVPAPDGNVQFSRIEETCALETVADEPGRDVVILARLNRRHGRWEVDAGYDVAAVKTRDSARS